MSNDAIDRLTVQKLRQFERDEINSRVERALRAVESCAEVHARALAQGIEVDCNGEPEGPCSCDALRGLQFKKNAASTIVTAKK